MIINTAMKELRDKLLVDAQNLKEASRTDKHLRGYREALKDVVDVIDARMMHLERQTIINAYNADLYGGLSGQKKFNDGDDYYNSVFGELS